MVRTGVIWIYRLRDSEDPNVDPVAHFDLTNPATSATDERAISRAEYYSDPDWATTVSGRDQLGDPEHRRAASRVERSAVGLACGRTSSRGCPPRATTTIMPGAGLDPDVSKRGAARGEPAAQQPAFGAL